MRWQIEPMPAWPYPETKARRESPFSAGWDDTLALLERELDALGVRGAVAIRVVGSPTDVRRDGMLRATARLAHPGVALSFESMHGPLTYPCDTFGAGPSWHRTGKLANWQVNVRAIALALEALRKVNRYGVGGHGEQYRGWRQIEAAAPTSFRSADGALAWLRSYLGMPTANNVPLLLAGAERRARREAQESGDRSNLDRAAAARVSLAGGGEQ